MVLLILIDALSSEYLTKENMPFLFDWAQKNNYVKKIKASCGYCERTEIFTGMYPSTSHNFTAIGYDEKNPVYKKSILLDMMHLFEKISSRNTRRAFNIYSKISKKSMLGYRIPFKILHKFSLTEDKFPHDCENAFKGESIFSIMNNVKKKYTLEVFTSLGAQIPMTDDERIEKAKSLLQSDYDFVPLYIGVIDAVGHKYVDNEEKMRESLLKVDKKLEEIISEAESINNKKIDIMVLGDHGMEYVTELVDIDTALKNLKLKKFVDYDYFLDSTIARFWCKNSEIKEKIIEGLDTMLSGKGFWVNDDNKYHIPYNCDSREYGDLIWCANTGVLIYPDFFNRQVDCGMHGYAEVTDRGKGLCIISGEPNISDECNLVDVCPTLCNMLDIDIPNKCEGVSFYGKRK